jgi:hypothetical protein
MRKAQLRPPIRAMRAAHVSEKFIRQPTPPSLEAERADGFGLDIERSSSMRKNHEDAVVPKLDWSSGVIMLDCLS